MAKYMADVMGLHSAAGKLNAKAAGLERREIEARNPALADAHDWQPAPMGDLCLRCRITRQEAILLLRENVCDPDWVKKELNQ